MTYVLLSVKLKSKEFLILLIFSLSFTITKSQVIITSIQQQGIPTPLNQVNWKDLSASYQTNVMVKGSGFSTLQSVPTSSIVLDSIKNMPSIKQVDIKEKVKNYFSIQNDEYIKAQIFKVIDDNNLELAFTFNQFATTGKKTLYFNQNKVLDFMVIAPNKLPEFQVVVNRQQIALDDQLTVYFPILNINNFKDITISKPGGTDLSGIQIIAIRPYLEQSQIAITLKISDQKYFDEGYRLYLNPKDSVSPSTSKYLLISQLFNRLNVPHLDFKPIKLYTDYSQEVLIFPTTQINLQNGKYRLKGFNNVDYDLIYGNESGEKYLKTNTFLLFPPNKGYSGSFEIVKIESGNTEVHLGYFVDIRGFKKEVFSDFELFQSSNPKITTLLISSDTSNNNFFLDFSVQNYPTVAKAIEERIYLKNAFNNRLPLVKIRNSLLEDQKTRYTFRFNVPEKFNVGNYKLMYLDLNDREIEINTYEFKALNTPLINNSNILNLSFKTKNGIQKEDLTPGDTVKMVKNIDFKNPQLALIVDLSNSEVKKYGEQYIKFDFEVIDENNLVIDKKTYEALFHAGEKTEIPLNAIIFTTYKAWYSIKISAAIIINKSNYTQIPEQYVNTQNFPIIKDEKIILVGNYLEKSIGLSFPLQQSIIYFNSKADVSAGEKKWVASPFTLSVDFNLNWRDKETPKLKYRWYMAGVSLLGNTTKLAEAENYYIGVLPFFGWRFQKLRRLNPNVVIGAGAAYHLIPSSNFSQIVPQIAFRFGFDISNQ